MPSYSSSILVNKWYSYTNPNSVTTPVRIPNAPLQHGNQTIASGPYSHSEGTYTTASGPYSHSEGTYTTANGIASHAEGRQTIAEGNYQHVTGEFNLTASTQSAFIIGNGTDGLNRSNLLFAAGNEVEVFGNTKTTNIQITNGATAGYVLTSDASGNGTWQSVAGASDTYVTGSTLNGTNLEINRNNGQPQITVDLSSLAGDVFTTGATYDNGTAIATFNRNDGNSYTLDLSTISVNDTFVTGSTLNGTDLELSRNGGLPTLTTDLSSLAGDIFTTGATYDNGTALATFNRNDGNSYTLDLSSIGVNDTFVTGSSLNGTTLEIKGFKQWQD